MCSYEGKTTIVILDMTHLLNVLHVYNIFRRLRVMVRLKTVGISGKGRNIVIHGFNGQNHHFIKREIVFLL